MFLRAHRNRGSAAFVLVASAIVLLLFNPAVSNAQRGFHSGGFGHSSGFSHSGFGGGFHSGFGGGFHSGFHGGFGRSRSSFFFSFGLGYYPSYYSYPYYPYYPYSYPVYYPVYTSPPPAYVYRDDYRLDPAPPVRREPDRRELDRREPDRTPSGDDDYYLHRKPTAPRDPMLTDSISDIEKAFRSNDIGPLEKHVAIGQTIMVYSSGRQRTSMTSGEYLDKTRDVFKTMKTVRFDLTRSDSEGSACRVSGDHTISGEDGKERRFRVSFLLSKTEDRWVIKEVNADLTR